MLCRNYDKEIEDEILYCGGKKNVVRLMRWSG